MSKRRMRRNGKVEVEAEAEVENEKIVVLYIDR
jgi:hypothetical protein